MLLFDCISCSFKSNSTILIARHIAIHAIRVKIFQSLVFKILSLRVPGKDIQEKHIAQN